MGSLNISHIVAWVLHRAGSLTLQRLAIAVVQLREALQVPNLIRKACDDDVRCSMGATERERERESVCS